MDLSRLTEPVEQGFQAVRRRWRRHDLADRLWDGDASVWSRDTSLPELANRLGWLRLHETMRSELPPLDRLAAEVRSTGLETVVLCGMGGSSLAPEVFTHVLGGGAASLVVLDSTHPDAVAAVREGIEPSRTIVVVSSKSGTTLETMSGFRAMWHALDGDGSRFVAVTDPGTPLAELGRERGFRHVFTADPEVGGRFSALTHFGLVPAVLCGIDPVPLLDAAADFAERRRGEGIGLGLAWAALAASGIDKLTFRTSPSLSSFPGWLEQLIAESLGKEGAGVVPIADEPAGSPAEYLEDRAFVSFRMEGERGGELEELAEAGFPVLEIELSHPPALAAAMLAAELATAAAGEVLGVHPFDQPNVEAAKRLAQRAMGGDLELESVPALTAAEGAKELESALEETGWGGYLAIQAFLQPTDELWDRVQRIRAKVLEGSGQATTAGWGPRFLHSTGQMHKGGPDGGVFLQLVDRPKRDMAVPETDHSFSRIVAAQAAGDYQALVEAGRRVIRVDLGSDPAGGLEELEARLW